MTNMFPNFQPVTYRGPDGTGSTVPEIVFYNSYEAVDREGWFYSNYYRNGSEEPFSLGVPFIFKHFNVTANGTFGVPGMARDHLNVPIIRFAEVLLIFAEADNGAIGPGREAVDALTQIRNRAELTIPDLGSFTQASLWEAIWKEPWQEQGYEQITWFDMVRLGKVFNSQSGGAMISSDIST